MNRKDKTVKQLQAECRKRKIGFMMNWTKAALIKRLEDEDNREKEILELKEQLKTETLQLKEQLAASQKKTGSLRNAAESVPDVMLKKAQRELDHEKTKKASLEKTLDVVRIKKSELSDEWVKSNRKIKELEALVKSLK